MDTTYVLGRGALKDTYNLLADGIIKLARALAARGRSDPEGWAREHDLGRYFGSSLKGEAGIDWDDPEAREKFLGGVVADADRVLMVAPETMEKLPAGDPERRRLHEAALVLERLLLQDIERGEDGTPLKRGVSPDRIFCVHDPEMRHGRKSQRRRFDGHKAHLAVDPESQLITAAEVLWRATPRPRAGASDGRTGGGERRVCAPNTGWGGWCNSARARLATSVQPRRFSSSLWPRASPISRSWRGGAASCETATTPRRTTPYTAVS